MNRYFLVGLFAFIGALGGGGGAHAGEYPDGWTEFRYSGEVDGKASYLIRKDGGSVTLNGDKTFIHPGIATTVRPNALWLIKPEYEMSSTVGDVAKGPSEYIITGDTYVADTRYDEDGSILLDFRLNRFAVGGNLYIQTHEDTRWLNDRGLKFTGKQLDVAGNAEITHGGVLTVHVPAISDTGTTTTTTTIDGSLIIESGGRFYLDKASFANNYLIHNVNVGELSMTGGDGALGGNENKFAEISANNIHELNFTSQGNASLTNAVIGINADNGSFRVVGDTTLNNSQISVVGSNSADVFDVRFEKDLAISAGRVDINRKNGKFNVDGNVSLQDKSTISTTNLVANTTIGGDLTLKDESRIDLVYDDANATLTIKGDTFFDEDSILKTNARNIIFEGTAKIKDVESYGGIQGIADTSTSVNFYEGLTLENTTLHGNGTLVLRDANGVAQDFYLTQGSTFLIDSSSKFGGLDAGTMYIRDTSQINVSSISHLDLSGVNLVVDTDADSAPIKKWGTSQMSVNSLNVERGSLLSEFANFTVHGDLVVGGEGHDATFGNLDRSYKLTVKGNAEIKDGGSLSLKNSDSWGSAPINAAEFEQGLLLDGGTIRVKDTIGAMNGGAANANLTVGSNDSRILLESDVVSTTGSLYIALDADMAVVFNAGSGKLSIDHDVQVSNRTLDVGFKSLNMGGGELHLSDTINLNVAGNIAIGAGATLSVGGDNTLRSSSGGISIANDATLVFDLGYAGGKNKDNALLTLDGTISGTIGSQDIVLQNARVNEDGRYYLVSGGTGTYTDTGSITHDDPENDYKLFNDDNSLAVTIKNQDEDLTMYWMNTAKNGVWDFNARNWSDNPDGIATNTIFMNDDSVVFDSTYATTDEDRTITVTSQGVTADEMKFVGAGDWRFSGGSINGTSLEKESSSTGLLTLASDANFGTTDIHGGELLIQGSLTTDDLDVAGNGSVVLDTMGSITVGTNTTIGSGAGIILNDDSNAIFGGGLDISDNGSLEVMNGATVDADDITVAADGGINIEAGGEINADTVVVQSGGKTSIDAGGTLNVSDSMTLDNGAILDLVAGDGPSVHADNFTSNSGAVINIAGFSDTSGGTITLVESNNAIMDGTYNVTVNGEDTTFKGEDTFLLVDVVGGNTNDIEVTAQLAWDMESDTTKAHGTFAIKNDEFTIESSLSDNAMVQAAGGGFNGWDGESLKKTGDGTLVLTAINTYTGNTEIQQGAIRVTNLEALGDGGDVNVMQNAGLEADIADFADSKMDDLKDLADRVALDADSSFTVRLDGTGDSFLLDGDLALGSAAAGSSFILSAPDKALVAADGAAVNAGSGDFILDADTTFRLVDDGQSSITANNVLIGGTLDLAAGSELNVAASAGNGNVVLENGGSIQITATNAEDIGRLNVAGTFTAEGTTTRAGANGANVFLGEQGEYYKDQAFIITTGGVNGFGNLLSNFFSLKTDGYSVWVTGMRSQQEIQENLFGKSGIFSNMQAGAAASDKNWDRIPVDLQNQIERYILQMDGAGVSTSAANMAFRQLYGEYAAYARTAQRTSHTQFRSYLSRWVDQQRSAMCSVDPCSGGTDSYQKRGGDLSNRIWAGGFGTWADQDSRDGISGYKYQSGGVILGYDHAVADNFLLGFSGAYSNGRTKVDDLRTRFDSDILNLGVYGAWFHDSGLYARAGAGFGYGWNDYDVNLAFGGKKDGKYKSQSWSGNLELGYEFNFANGFNLTPSTGVDVAYYRNNSWTEGVSGNAVANRFASKHETVADIPLALKVNRVWNLGNGCYIAPEVSASWIYSAGSRRDGIVASYAGAPFEYEQKGVSTSRHRWQIGTGIKARLAKNIEVRADYNLELRKRYRDHNFMGSVGLAF